MCLHQLIISQMSPINFFQCSIIANLQTTPAVLKPSFIMFYCALKADIKSVTEWLKHYCHWVLQAFLTIFSENWLQYVPCSVWNLITTSLWAIDNLWTITGWCNCGNIFKMCSSVFVRFFKAMLGFGMHLQLNNHIQKNVVLKVKDDFLKCNGRRYHYQKILCHSNALVLKCNDHAAPP